MSWIKFNVIKTGFQIALITTLLLFLIEGISSLVFYHKLRLPLWSVSSAVHLFVSSQALDEKFTVEIVTSSDPNEKDAKDKLHKVLSERDENKNTYPSYLFEPQYHHPSSPYMLANVASSNIVYCDENGFFNNWISDELGFRNPEGQINSSIDYVFLGDSFTAGACEQEDGTIPGFFRLEGFTVANLGRGGSGPLFQLATLVEYGYLFDSDELIWVVFTGNDLLNLTEEKGTVLGNYLDPGFSQKLYLNRVEIQNDLKEFLDAQLSENKARFDSGIRYPVNKGYGEALDSYSAQKYEAALLKEVAKRILDVASEQGKTLNIVILDHHAYDNDFKRITAQAIKEFSADNSVKYLQLSSEFLTMHKNLYTESGGHFNANGYIGIGGLILEWLETLPLKSTVK